MPSSLLKKHVRLDRLRARVADCVSAPGHEFSSAIQAITAGLHQILRKAQIFYHDHEHGIEQSKLHAHLLSLVGLPELQRQQALRDLFSEHLAEGFDGFHELVKAAAQEDAFQLVREHYDNDIPPRELTLPLQLDWELLMAAIQTLQQAGKATEWVAFLKEKIPAQVDGTEPSLEPLDLNGAALPDMFPKTTKYAEALLAYTEGDRRRMNDHFAHLTEAFKYLAVTVFNEDHESFYGNATTKNFEGLWARFSRVFPHAEMVYTSYEYLPMVDRSVSSGQRHEVTLESLDIPDEELIAQILAKGEQIRMRRKRSISQRLVPLLQRFDGLIDNVLTWGTSVMQRTYEPLQSRHISGVAANEQPIVIFLSSQSRMGGRLVDVEKIATTVKTENARLGFQQYHLWVDASQDSRIIHHGDVIFYSKRYAGSGGGLVVIQTDTYPEDNRDIREALRIRYGFSTKFIPRIMASLFLHTKKIGNEFGDLLRYPTLALYQGKGGHLEAELTKAQTYLEQSPLLHEFFTMTWDLPPAEQWRIDAIVRFDPTSKGHNCLNIPKLHARLRDRYVIDLSCFDLSDCGKESRIHMRDLWALHQQKPFDVQKFLRIAEEFQYFYSDHLVRTLVPQKNRHNADYVRRYFERAVREHSYFRVLATGVQRPNYLLDFVKRLELAVQEELTAQES